MKKRLTYCGFESLYGADEEIIEAIGTIVPSGEFQGSVIVDLEYVPETSPSPTTQDIIDMFRTIRQMAGDDWHLGPGVDELIERLRKMQSQLG